MGEERISDERWTEGCRAWDTAAMRWGRGCPGVGLVQYVIVYIYHGEPVWTCTDLESLNVRNIDVFSHA